MDIDMPGRTSNDEASIVAQIQDILVAGVESGLSKAGFSPPVTGRLVPASDIAPIWVTA
jgi:hypothetical protein